MTAGDWLTLAQGTSIQLTVLALGMQSDLEDVIYLFRHPTRLWRSLLSMNIIMPACAVALALMFPLTGAVKVAIVTLAISPVPPTLPKKQLKAGGHPSYAIALLGVEALLAIAFIPAVLALLGPLFRLNLQMRISTVAKIVFATVWAPLLLGIILRWYAPKLARRIAGPIAIVASVVLVVCMVAILFAAASDIASLFGNGTVLAIAVYSVLGVAVGHLLGGPDPDGRAVLAVSSATRHPGVAAAIVSANFPNPGRVPAAILLFLLVGGIVTSAYTRWIKRRTGNRTAEAV